MSKFNVLMILFITICYAMQSPYLDEVKWMQEIKIAIGNPFLCAYRLQ